MSVEAAAEKDFKVLVDFDRTLFDTDAFAQDLWEVIAAESGRTPETAARDALWFRTDAARGGYMYEDHITSYGLDAEHMWKSVDDLVAANDYLYADGPAFISRLRDEGYDPSILTFGETRMQTAKLKPYMGRLAANGSDAGKPLEYIVVMQKKSEYIAQNYPDIRGALVDDVIDQYLPDGFVEINLRRGSVLSEAQTKAGGFIVSDLVQALEVIRSL